MNSLIDKPIYQLINPLKDFLLGMEIEKSSSEQFLEALGSITIEFSALEYFLIEIISQIISSESKFTVRLLAGDSFSVLLSKFRKLSIYEFQNEKFMLKEFTLLYKGLEKVNKERNKYLHSLWHFEKDGTIVRFKYKDAKLSADLKKIDPSISEKEVIDIKDLISCKNRIAENLVSLIKFYSRFRILKSYEKEENGNKEKENNQEET